MPVQFEWHAEEGAYIGALDDIRGEDSEEQDVKTLKVADLHNEKSTIVNSTLAEQRSKIVAPTDVHSEQSADFKLSHGSERVFTMRKSQHAKPRREAQD